MTGIDSKIFLLSAGIFLCFALSSGEGIQDFQFDNDDLQIIFTEPNNMSYVSQKAFDAKEKKPCSDTESRILLTLILKSHNWGEIADSKRKIAANKLAKFFAVPKELLTVDNVSKFEIYEMNKFALQQGNRVLESDKKHGRFEFQIGCGKNLNQNGKLIASQISQQVKDGTIDDLTGLEIGWWAIWAKHVNNRVSRVRRETEGSGEDDYGDQEGDDEEDIATDSPTDQNKHRHQHGSNKPAEVLEASTTKSVLIDDSTVTSIEPQENLMINSKLDHFTTEKFMTGSSTTVLPNTIEESNYDDEYTDEEDIPKEELSSNSKSTTKTNWSTKLESIVKATTTEKQMITEDVPTVTSTMVATTTDIAITSIAKTSISSIEYVASTESMDVDEIINTKPMIRNRLPKQPVTAGKPFSLNVPQELFYDQEDGTNLRLELLDKNEQALPQNSWIQFNADKREIYGLPLEDSVSRWQFKVKGTDSGGMFEVDLFDVTVQQHKGHRSVNHEIVLGLKLNKPFPNNVDWQIKLIRGITEMLGDSSMASVVVQDVRFSKQDMSSISFAYTNETLPKDKCPDVQLKQLLTRMNIDKLNNLLSPEINVVSINGEQTGSCVKQIPKINETPSIATRNYPPVPRNQVDRVNATFGQLLVFKVPADTFYDPEDENDLKLTLTTAERTKLEPHHWLQFDSKNHEFYGVPKAGDVGQREYFLNAEDKGGLTATDALIVVVNHSHKRDYSALFEVTLGMAFEQFNNSATQRRFVERISQVFQDQTTSNILIRSIRHVHHSGNTLVTFYNTTLYRTGNRCPDSEIETLRNVLLHQDSSIRDNIKDIIGSEYDIKKINLVPVGSCQGADTVHHEEIAKIKPDDSEPPIFKEDYLLTYVLPSVIILLMLFISLIIACVLYRRRMTGKMELGDEEERKSFRSKGIPVIFQDELDEKPEIRNKSPIILKDEKPPLLPQYNGMNTEENEDVDEYVPPPAVMMGNRESRGKSPVTPSYRKPPPYVSP